MGSIVDDMDVVGACVVDTGLASGGAKVHSSYSLNSTSSIATKPFPLLLRCTRNFICQINGKYLFELRTLLHLNMGRNINDYSKLICFHSLDILFLQAHPLFEHVLPSIDLDQYVHWILDLAEPRLFLLRRFHHYLSHEFQNW